MKERRDEGGGVEGIGGEKVESLAILVLLDGRVSGRAWEWREIYGFYWAAAGCIGDWAITRFIRQVTSKLQRTTCTHNDWT